MSDIVRTFQSVVRDFFEKHLTIERAAGPNTVASYRDGMKLFLRYAAEAHDCTADQLGHEVLDGATVRGFLEWLRTERNNGPRTRNHRLAVLKSFAAYAAAVDPRHLERCRAVRELPRATYEQPEPQWLDEHEITQLIHAVRPDHRARDRALLMLLYDTGARVQEVADLNVGDLHTDAPAFIQFRAKGGRQRTNCIGNETLKSISAWCEVRQNVTADAPLFVNPRGERLTRAGIAWIVAHTARRAGLEPCHATGVTPHVLRHTTAMHLLESGVDITTVAAWMGHASLDTTNDYVQITLRMKQEALAALAQPAAIQEQEYPDDELIDWLNALARTPCYVKKPSRNIRKSLKEASRPSITSGFT